jgi:hypothetical protein
MGNAGKGGRRGTNGVLFLPGGKARPTGAVSTQVAPVIDTGEEPPSQPMTESSPGLVAEAPVWERPVTPDAIPDLETARTRMKELIQRENDLVAVHAWMWNGPDPIGAVRLKQQQLLNLARRHIRDNPEQMRICEHAAQLETAEAVAAGVEHFPPDIPPQARYHPPSDSWRAPFTNADIADRHAWLLDQAVTRLAHVALGVYHYVERDALDDTQQRRDTNYQGLPYAQQALDYIHTIESTQP